MFSGDLKSMFFIQFTNYIHIWYCNKFAKLLIRSNTGIDGILVIHQLESCDLSSLEQGSIYI